jgi:hypothetical protein
MDAHAVDRYLGSKRMLKFLGAIQLHSAKV